MYQITESHKPTMSSLDKYQKLIMQHAKYSDLIKELKQKGAYESTQCLGVDTTKSALGEKPFMDEQWEEMYQLKKPNNRVHCIQNAIDCNKDDNTQGEEFGEHFYFEHTWKELIQEKLVCKHCIEVRRLKAERMKAIAHLGAVRAAMTKMGRKLAKEKS